MRKLSIHLWFDKEAREAAGFYTSVFAVSEGKEPAVTNTTKLHDTPSGTVDFVTIQLFGQEFTLLSAGPLFKFNPSISFLVACHTKDEVAALWQRLSEGGTVLMPLGEYPFSSKYGWTQDRYGVSWQVMFMGEREIKQKIIPTLMFVGDVCGRAEEAMHSAHEHHFSFNEAISIMVHCDTQEEIDYYWGKLSAVPAAEQCGWLKDKYGLSWQIVPTLMNQMLKDKDPKKLAQVTQAFLKMKKFDIDTLERAYRQ